jgi:hypothetical protein
VTPEQQAVIDAATPEQIFASAVRVGRWIFLDNAAKAKRPSDEDLIRVTVYDSEIHGSAVKVALEERRAQLNARRRPKSRIVDDRL